MTGPIDVITVYGFSLRGWLMVQLGTLSPKPAKPPTPRNTGSGSRVLEFLGLGFKGSGPQSPKPHKLLFKAGQLGGAGWSHDNPIGALCDENHREPPMAVRHFHPWAHCGPVSSFRVQSPVSQSC